MPYRGRSNISSMCKQHEKPGGKQLLLNAQMDISRSVSPAALTRDTEPSSHPKKPNLIIKPPIFRISNSLGAAYDSPDSSPFRTAMEYPSSSSSFRAAMHRNASVPIPEVRFSPPDSEAEDYGEIVDTELDALALNQLQPRLQASMRALKAEKDDHRAMPGRSPSEPLLGIKKQKVIELVSQARSVSEGREAGSKRKRGTTSQSYGEAEGKEAEIKRQHIELEHASASEAREADLTRKRMPLSSNPLTEMERAEARALTERCRSAPSRRKLQDQLLTIKSTVKQPNFKNLSSISPQLPPGPINRRQILSNKSHASIRAPKPRLAKISGRMGTARKWIKKMLRKETDRASSGKVEWEEDAEYDDNDDEDEDDEDKNADEDDNEVSNKVDRKENRLRDYRRQKTHLKRFTPSVDSSAKPPTTEPLPSEPRRRPSPARPQEPGQPTSRAAMEGYF